MIRALLYFLAGAAIAAAGFAVYVVWTLDLPEEQGQGWMHPTR